MKVFLSHSSIDKPFVKEFDNAKKAFGVSTFLDETTIYMKTIFLIFFYLLTIPAFSQDTVTLNNGQILTGTIDGISQERISIHAADSSGNYVLPVKSVKTIVLCTHVGLRKLDRSDIYIKKVLTANEELMKASSLLGTGIVISGIGILTAIAGPYLTKAPTEFRDFANYSKTIKTVQLIGCGIFFIGTTFEISSISHFNKAGQKFKVLNGRDGLGIAMTF